MRFEAIASSVGVVATRDNKAIVSVETDRPDCLLDSILSGCGVDMVVDYLLHNDEAKNEAIKQLRDKGYTVEGEESE